MVIILKENKDYEQSTIQQIQKARAPDENKTFQEARLRADL